MHFHTDGDERYWDETACYVFTARQIEDIERATYSLNQMCLDAAQHIIDENRFSELLIPPQFVPFIKESWERDELTIVGRFDFVYDGNRQPALLEFNADTPTSLLEASVIQWDWFKDVGDELSTGSVDQFNNIHERLLEAWKLARSQVPANNNATLHVGSVGIEASVEDYITAEYLRDVASQAGWNAIGLSMADVGWDHQRRRFTDRTGSVIEHMFKLYPWEWMIHEQFAPCLLQAPVRWWEPPWKMVLSNKALLAILYELFPQSPYLLPTGFEPLAETYVRKPLLSREGANISIIHKGKTMIETPGDYDEGHYVYQEFRPLPNFDGNYVVVGSWMVNGYSCGIGLREDRTLITGNMSRFIPHILTR
jgi:glutathionylspermidine synthase